MRKALIGAGLLAVSLTAAPAVANSADQMQHDAVGAAVSFADLKATVEALNAAHAATEKYRDVRVAEADGYRAIGPAVPGMGLHYFKPGIRGFDARHPPFLLYEPEEGGPKGLSLVGVAYMIGGPVGPDGQPAAAPFPPALAAWHKHYNICLFADNSVEMHGKETDCEQRGGRFISESPWMLHAWIWKDSPAGVFSQTNPNVR
jgi:hypothetical protein